MEQVWVQGEPNFPHIQAELEFYCFNSLSYTTDHAMHNQSSSAIICRMQEFCSMQRYTVPLDLNKCIFHEYHSFHEIMRSLCLEFSTTAARPITYIRDSKLVSRSLIILGKEVKKSQHDFSTGKTVNAWGSSKNIS